MKAALVLKSIVTKRASRRVSPRPAPRARLQLEALETRIVPYNISGNAWPHPELVTISFTPDGTNLGGVTSNLFTTFNAKWATSVWQAQILKAAQVYAQQTNINFALVSDSGADSGSGSYQQGDPTMGDIRIGGYVYSSNSILASGILPPPVNNYSITGDISLNTGQNWVIGTSGGYDLFTVMSHEMGHALGLLHSGSSNADLYSYYTQIKTALKPDDIAGVRNIYSNSNARSADTFGRTNTSFTTAADLSAQIDPTALTALVTNLDNTTSTGTAGVEYFTFTAPSATTGALTVNVQSSGLSLLAPAMTVYASDQATVLGSASGSGQYGTTLSLTVNGVSAGQQFYVKVAGADSSAFGAGKYAMTVNFGSSPSPTVPLPNTQVVNGSPLSGGGGVAMTAPNASPKTITSPTANTWSGSTNSIKGDSLTIDGFNSLMHGGGCGCPLCTAAAAQQAQEVLILRHETAFSSPLLQSTVAAQSPSSLLGNALGEPGATPAPGNEGSRMGNRELEQILSHGVGAPRADNGDQDRGPGNGVWSGSEERLLKSQAIMAAAAPVVLRDTDSIVLVQAGTASWQLTCEACFEQESLAASDTASLQFADNGGDEGPDGVVAAAAVFALAAYGSARHEEPARRRHLQAVIC